jgi:hypothetical protein
MHFENQRGDISISLDADDNESEFLEAFVRASYELAPMNPMWPGSGSDLRLSEEDVHRSLRVPPRSWDKVVIQMDQLHGRICKTIVVETKPRQYEFKCSFFSAYRKENPRTVLERAIQILSVSSA